MNRNFGFALVAAVMALGATSPALAHSHSARTCACRNPQSVQDNGGLAAGQNGPYYDTVSPYYDYVPGQGVQPYWPSAAALGNSH
jgi:hypothetical protein